MNSYTIRNVVEADLDRCAEIERLSYPKEEAATKDKILKRIRTYPQGFLVIEQDKKILGFINCGATDQVDLADEPFKDLVGHDPQGAYGVVFSVVVHPDCQGQGLAGRLMTAFISQMKKMRKKAIYLICKEGLIPFYEKFGFVYLGASGSTHGGARWHEMVCEL